MVSASRILGLPLVVTEQYPKGLGNTVQEIKLNNTTDKVFSKTQFSMLIPEIRSLILTDDIKNVVLFGIEAHVCILQTTMDLIECGVDVHILMDGTSSSQQFERFIAFNRLRNSGAFLTSTESVLFQILGDATHPQFKDISKLIVEHSRKKIDPEIVF